MKLIEVIQKRKRYYHGLNDIELILEPETSDEAKFLRDKAKLVFDKVNYSSYNSIMNMKHINYKFDYSIGRYDCYGCWVKEWDHQTHRTILILDYFKDMLRGYLTYSKNLTDDEVRELIKHYHIFELEAEAEYSYTKTYEEYPNLNNRYKLFLNTCIEQNPDSTILINLLNKLK